MKSMEKSGKSPLREKILANSMAFCGKNPAVYALYEREKAAALPGEAHCFRGLKKHALLGWAANSLFCGKAQCKTIGFACHGKPGFPWWGKTRDNLRLPGSLLFNCPGAGNA